jgi:hypothetical protein
LGSYNVTAVVVAVPLLPPNTSTLFDRVLLVVFNNTAWWDFMADAILLFVAPQPNSSGSKVSAVLRFVFALMPPVSNTFPSARRVAVCECRPRPVMLVVWSQVPTTGS